MYRFHFNPKLTRVSEQGTLREALGAITASGALVACIVDSQDKLLAILTDSDVRRALLKGANIDDSVQKWCNRTPTVLNESDSFEQIEALIEQTGKREFPVVDDKGRLTDIFVLGAYDQRRLVSEGDLAKLALPSKGQDSSAFILAGGLGTRLRSVVEDRPKPLAKIGDKTLIQILVDRLIREGFRKFYVSLNYMGSMIEAHLNDVFADSPAKFEYLYEPKRLGTAGSLAFVKDRFSEAFLVCNADILTVAPYRLMLDSHLKAGATITCALRSHKFRVPFGVVRVEGESVRQIEEKPDIDLLVNAGIYILDPKALPFIPDDTQFDMPELINKVIEAGLKVDPFYLHEYWVDVGRPEDFQKANSEWPRESAD
jgi:dTDP-glucose pyrophosphorylase